MIVLFTSVISERITRDEELKIFILKTSPVRSFVFVHRQKREKCSVHVWMRKVADMIVALMYSSRSSDLRVLPLHHGSAST